MTLLIERALPPRRRYRKKMVGEYLSGRCRAGFAFEIRCHPAIDWTKPVISPMSSYGEVHHSLEYANTPAINEWLIFGHDFGTLFINIYI